MSNSPQNSCVAERMEVHEIPERSLTQRMDALASANDIRIFRAKLKRELKEGHKDICALIENPPEKIKTMKVFDLLLSVPKLGRVKVNKMLNVCRLSSSKTVGGMSDRQRNELLVFLRRR